LVGFSFFLQPLVGHGLGKDGLRLTFSGSCRRCFPIISRIVDRSRALRRPRSRAASGEKMIS